MHTDFDNLIRENLRQSAANAICRSIGTLLAYFGNLPIIPQTQRCGL
jgi:hypothetical protein